MPLTQWNQKRLTMLPWFSVGTQIGKEFTHNFWGDSHPWSSQPSEPLWTDPCPKRVVHQLISTWQIKVQVGNDSLNISPHNSHMQGKSHTLVYMLSHICVYAFVHEYLCFFMYDFVQEGSCTCKLPPALSSIEGIKQSSNSADVSWNSVAGVEKH